MGTLAKNRKAHFNYELLENFEGGLVLSGAEVKAAKRGHINMKGAFLSIVNNELWLKNMHIGKFAPAGKQEDYVPTQNRKVLVKRREIKSLTGKADQKGLTIVPISVYTKGDLVKLGFALAKGKKNHEKRDAIKKRDISRHIQEEMKR
ncbi:SsrA-binding protein [Candidatus Uhrbacteria bacterium CG_4_10_14_0_2_um_filter_41_7]|uniref:SsrA-binding protein n=1 Tax=Candidatus Uhrbacteria bacterium CG_4_9_14_3_um_filter_41_35 TaxID=1975034 RepID=A0A2M7XFP1_9BACT|nr:MAG: SsrA-binding protein [Candidatus Uhrbacteria bacterium CG11_big_fil_rev_8_21_14_0_20_41_9]PIZ54341.1 MAG: SsrA-binding protein [Candidatus Uhrbacteria bacterium CG_4_10_14_0_2_um_filter_41_7]PJA46694.1 MAG: SsrA-binding protein [Candidatus Uhrbacteria bacterium CG_4_9_14_3_um_filter_41_35]